MLRRQQVISNGSVRLIPMQPEHQALFVELFSNKKIMRQIGDPLSPEVAVRTFAKALNNDVETRRHYYWVIENALGAEAGIAALILQPDNAAEVGVMLLPKFSRQGLAHLASASLIEYTFRFWQTDTVLISHKATNLPVPLILASLFMQCVEQGEELWHWQLTGQQWQQLTGLAPYQITV